MNELQQTEETTQGLHQDEAVEEAKGTLNEEFSSSESKGSTKSVSLRGSPNSASLLGSLDPLDNLFIPCETCPKDDGINLIVSHDDVLSKDAKKVTLDKKSILPEYTIHKESSPNYCANCRILQLEATLIATKIKELEAKCKKTSGTGKGRSAEKSAEAVGRSKKVTDWKAYYEELEKKFDQIGEKMMREMATFDECDEHCQSENDKLRNRLIDEMNRLEDLRLLLRTTSNNNSRLLSALLSATRAEKHKKQNEEAQNQKVMETEAACLAKEYRIAQLEYLIRKLHDDNHELSLCVGKFNGDLGGFKHEKKEQSEYRRHLKDRLEAILMKFKTEANNSKENMKYALDYFESAAKIIESDEPHLRSLLLEQNIASIDPESGKLVEKSKNWSGGKVAIEREQPKDAMELQSSIVAKIQPALQEFYQTHTDELCHNLWNILVGFDVIEKRVGSRLSKRIDDFDNNLAITRSKQHDVFSTMQEELEKFDVNIEMLGIAIGELSQKMKTKSKERDDELKMLKRGRMELRKTCTRTDRIQLQLQAKLRQLEMNFVNPQKELHVNPEISTPSTSTATDEKVDRSSKKWERTAAEIYKSILSPGKGSSPNRQKLSQA